MNPMTDNINRRLKWLGLPLGAALVCALLRRWQLGTAFEEETGLAIRNAPASVVLACLLVMSAAWLMIQAAHETANPKGQWDLVFLDTGEMVYPGLLIVSALMALAAVPFLLRSGMQQWQDYRAAAAADLQLPSDNGVLTIATAIGSLLSFVGLLQIGRDGLHAGRRGKGGFSAALPGVAGCMWLMESFRAHAANPVQWDYAPLLLAIVCGMLFYMDFAGISAGSARPQRFLWMAAMTVVLSGTALVSAWTEKTWADVLLLLAQSLAAAAVLWRMPPLLEHPPRPRGIPIPRGETSIQEEEPIDE